MTITAYCFRSMCPSTDHRDIVTIIMDALLHFDSTYGAIICKPCQYAVVSAEIQSHLRTPHQHDLALKSGDCAVFARRLSRVLSSVKVRSHAIFEYSINSSALGALNRRG